MKQCLYFYMIIILMKSRFKKYVILQKSTAVRSIDTSKINMTQQIIAKSDTSADITTPESFEDFIYYIGNNKKIFKHLLVSSRQADVFRSLTNVSREMMLNNPTRKRAPLAQKIRESKHPEIVADFYSSGVIEVLRRWVENDYNYTVEEVFVTLNNVLETSLYCYDK